MSLLISWPAEVLEVLDRRPLLHGRYLRAAASPPLFVCLRNSPDFVHSSHQHFDRSSGEPESGCSSVAAAFDSRDCIELDRGRKASVPTQCRKMVVYRRDVDGER